MAKGTLLLLSVWLFFAVPLSAQTQLTGTVRDGADKAVPAASVLLLRAADSTLVKGQLSAADGSFFLDGVAAGDYRLGVNCLGYVNYFSEPFTIAGESKKDLGTITLSESAEQLTEVNVVAKRPLFEQKIDRLVVNVASSIVSAGSTALEVLQRSPGMLVNRGANLLSMAGKNGVVVMINGKISRLPADAILQLLDGMSADNIERIELVYTPPANFDAEGNAGIINIVLKKNADDGLNGAASAYAGYGFREKAGANANANFRHNRLNVYGDYSWTYDNNPQLFTQYRAYEKDGVLLENATESDRDPTRTHTQNGRVGADLQLGARTVVGGLAGWMDRYWTMTASNAVTMRANGAATGFITIPNDELNHWRHYLGNLNVEHKFTTQQRLNIDVDYASYHFNNPSNYVNRFLDAEGQLLDETRLRVRKTTPMRIFAAKADFTRNFGERLTLESGVKSTLTRFDNDVRVDDFRDGAWTTLPEYTAAVHMEEDIAAAYTALTTRIGDKTDLKTGLRYEYTRSNLGSAEQPDIVDRRYGRLFPSVFVSHKLNATNSLQVSYSRRIQRPDFNMLAPYFIFYDPTTVETGNPRVQPSISDGVKVDYLWKSVQLSLQGTYEDESITGGQPIVDTATNRQINSVVNFDYARYGGATVSVPLHPAEWWDVQSSLSTFYVHYRGHPDAEGIVADARQLSFSGFASSTFRLGAGFALEVSGWYFSGGPFGRTVGQPIGSLDAGLQKDFGERHGTLRLALNDALFTANWSARIDDDVNRFYFRSRYRQSERAVRLTYSRKFGSEKVKAARQRATGSEEERRRVH